MELRSAGLTPCRPLMPSRDVQQIRSQAMKEIVLVRPYDRNVVLYFSEISTAHFLLFLQNEFQQRTITLHKGKIRSSINNSGSDILWPRDLI